MSSISNENSPQASDQNEESVELEVLPDPNIPLLPVPHEIPPELVFNENPTLEPEQINDLDFQDEDDEEEDNYMQGGVVTIGTIPPSHPEEGSGLEDGVRSPNLVYSTSRLPSTLPSSTRVLPTTNQTESQHPPSRNLAQWVGNELVKELERELAHVKAKLIARQASSKNNGDSDILISELMEEVARIGDDIKDLQLEQERIRKIGGRSAKGELKARLDAAIAENLLLRRRKEEIRNILGAIMNLKDKSESQSPSGTSSRSKASASLADIQKEVDDLKVKLQEVKDQSNPGCSKEQDDCSPPTVGLVMALSSAHVHNTDLLRVQFDDLQEQLNLRNRLDDNLEKRVEDLESEIARLKNELISLTKKMARG